MPTTIMVAVVMIVADTKTVVMIADGMAGINIRRMVGIIARGRYRIIIVPMPMRLYMRHHRWCITHSLRLHSLTL
jgi:hypothetical protein